MQYHKYLFKDYSLKINQALEKVDQNEVDKLFDQIDKIIGTSSNIYLLGNGGSQANAHHIAGDFIKTFSIFEITLAIVCAEVEPAQFRK